MIFVGHFVFRGLFEVNNITAFSRVKMFGNPRVMLQYSKFILDFVVCFERCRLLKNIKESHR